MDNYKIKVKDEAESKEAQELFFALGYEWRAGGKNYFKVGSGQILAYSNGFLFQIGNESGQELTLSELRALANAKTIQDPALISGVEALADITKVQHAYNCSDDWFTTQYSTLTIPEILKGKTNCGHEIKFRVKPTTISINTEIPKPEREFHQNTEIFSVTYEFKTREERNVFARKLRGTNS